MTETPKHNCDVCGEPAVTREGNGHYYCYTHLEQWRRCKEFKQIKEEYDGKTSK